MKLVFIHGAPAVGKLTVARELAALTGFRLFHNHLTVDLVSSLFPFGSEPFVVLREKIWLAAFAEAVRNNVSLIFTFNPERTVRESFIQDTIELVEGAEQIAGDQRLVFFGPAIRGARGSVCPRLGRRRQARAASGRGS